MIYRILADIVLILHFCFVLFVVFGGLLVVRRRWVWRLHLPALGWGILVEFLRLPCPLTMLEKYFTELGGETAYTNDFIEHYLSPILYSGITPQIMQLFGALLIIFNLLVYFYILRQMREPLKSTL